MAQIIRKRAVTKQEEHILIGMITSSSFLKRIIPIYDPSFFKSGLSKKVALWCTDYFEEFEEAPAIHIKDIFKKKIRIKKVTEEDAEAIEILLKRISNKFENSDKFNVDFLLKEAQNYFKQRQLEKNVEDVSALLDINDVETADEIFSNYKAVKINDNKSCQPLKDPDSIQKPYIEQAKPLFKMKGALGKLVNHDLLRESFIGIIGREKIGKTRNLMEFVFTALEQRCNVALFQAGDLSEAQQTRRMHSRLTRSSATEEYAGKLLVPVYDCIHNQNNSCSKRIRTSKVGIYATDELLESIIETDEEKKTVYKEATEDGYVPCDYCKRKGGRLYKGSVWWKEINIGQLDERQVFIACKKFERRTGKKEFFMSTHYNSTLTVKIMKQKLQEWYDYYNFIPDFIAVDYPDIMSTDESKKDPRHQVNDIWKGLRAIAQEFNCLVMAVTQADANAFEAKTITLKNFSEDKRKYAHVTSFLSINQTDEEKVMGIMRYAVLLQREGNFDSRRQAKVMQCYTIERANLGGFF